MRHLFGIVLLSTLAASAASAEDLWLLRLERGADWVEELAEVDQPHAAETREYLNSQIRSGVVLMIARVDEASWLVVRAKGEERAAAFATLLPTVRNDVHRYRLSEFELFYLGDLASEVQLPEGN